MTVFNKLLIVLFLLQGAMLIIDPFAEVEESVEFRKLTELNKSQINFLTIEGRVKYGMQKIHLQKIDNKWVLPKKYGFPVRTKFIDMLIAQISNIRLGQSVAQSKGSHVRMRVDDNQFTRKITWKNGDKEEGFFMGTPAGKSYSMTHIRLIGEKKVYQAEIEYQWRVGVATRDWINPIIMNLDVDEVIEFKQVHRFSNGSKDVLHARRINGSWRIQGPQVNAKGEAFDSVSFKSYLSIQGFWDLEEVVGKGAPYPEESRLTDPIVAFTFTVLDKKTKKTRQESVLIGNRRRQTGNYYVRVKNPGNNFIYTISPKKLATLALRHELFGDAYRKRQQVKTSDDRQDFEDGK